MTVLADVNVLVAAHRRDHPAHEASLAILDGRCRDGFALCAHTWNGFLHLVTHPGIFAAPTPIEIAVATVTGWRDRPRSEVLHDTADSWTVHARLCRQHQAQGNAVYDLHLAALAISHGCTLISSDHGFARIAGLDWAAP